MTRKAGSVILVHAAVEMDSTMRVPAPLGMLYLGAALKARDFPVAFFDLHFESTTWATVEAAVDGSKPCLAGFSCTTNNLHRVLHLSDRLVRRFPHVTVVLGGPHVTHVWEPYVTERRWVIRDDGEHALPLLAGFVLRGEGSLDAIPSLAYVADGELRANPVAFGPYEDIDAIPFPDYTLLPAKEFYIPAMVTGRGCPHRCHFCSETGRRRPYSPRSADSVEQELLALKAFYGERMRYMAFNDDTFTASARRVHELCDVIDRVFPDKSRFSFWCEARADVLAQHPELVHRLKKSGVLGMQLGVESGNQKLLDQMNKRMRKEQIEAAVAHCGEAGIPFVAGNFIFGLPHQSKEDIECEFTFARRLVDLAPERLELTAKALMPFPGTEYRRNAATWGLSLLDEDFVSGRMSNASFVRTSLLSREEIERTCDRFRAEIGDYTLEQASPRLSPRVCKEQVILAAETSQRTFVLSRLCQFGHIARLVLLRRRTDHRFLFEIPEEDIPQAAPVGIPENAATPTKAGYTINKGSPLEFELSADDIRYYRYFVGKLTFDEIAQRVSEEASIARDEAYDHCLAAYMECEDSLAAIAMI